MNEEPDLNIAVVGAGPAGLALALHAAQQLPRSRICVFDARAADKDVSGDPRTLALSLGSVQLFERLRCWPASQAQPILEVHVSQQPPGFGESELRLKALDEAVPMLGAVLRYGQIVAPLQQAWFEAVAREPQRLGCRFGVGVTELKPVSNGVEVDAGVAETFDLAVVAEGGVFAGQPQRGLHHDYRQTAWVGQLTFADEAPSGVAFERFTRHGPVALLPLRGVAGSPRQAALVWCVPSDDDPVRELNDAQRLTVLQQVFHPSVGKLASISPLKHFPLGLNARPTLVRGRSVHIGNAAQTLHPVAGQGLNLGLRDAFELVAALRRAAAAGGKIDDALRRVEWARASDRWSMIAATDFLARSFTWTLPGLGVARGLGLAALELAGPVKSALARQMMFGRR